MPNSTTLHTNRLAQAKSPYLLQHQHNPVDWFQWGEEAFSKARRENKPIFLSIGYSTCHWCHVMERESFENQEIADFLNAHFVSIKVDREERPDIDKIYMTAVQAMTGQGGWPLNCMLTPDLKPFFCGTYFPAESKYGRIGFLDLLGKIQQLWESQRSEIETSAVDFHQKLENYVSQNESTHPLTDKIVQRAADLLKTEYAPEHAGFGGAPKFPRPSQPLFILRHGWITKDSEAIQMVLNTCDRMAAGGIQDQIGGGFHRYSVDAKWLVPHFEKMLYDNAQLINLYIEAYLTSKKQEYAQVVHRTIEYVLRDMTDENGGFYSAEDADSEGKEGKFYCWTLAELNKALTPAELDAAVRFWGVTEEGNFVDHSDPDPLPGQNILSIVQTPVPPEDQQRLDSATHRLFQLRKQRIRPHLDDKVLASWNGMMLGALARAYAVFKETRYLESAEKNLAFLREALWDDTCKILYHRWREGERDQVQLLDAYANLLAGVLDLYEATLKPTHLEFATNLANTLLKKFYDAHEGGFFQSEAEDLILRVKDSYDGAEPSGNSVACLALLRLGVMTGNPDYTSAAENTLQFFSRQFHMQPQAVPHMLLALSFLIEEPHRAIITGDPGDIKTRNLIHTVHSSYEPNRAILGTSGPVDPFAKTLPPQKTPSVFYCSGTSCQPPVTMPAEDAEKEAVKKV